MSRCLSILLAGIAVTAFANIAVAQNYDIDPATMPGKARFMALAQEQFDQDHSALFQTMKPAPEDEQAVFACGIKAVLADMPDGDAAKAADMIEGKSEPDPAILKWFALGKAENPERRLQVMTRAHQICPQFKEIMK